uniref:Heme-binding protein soul2 n=1 Tax=Mastacembelus armatus TaxID=205130 RepID=A0A3Q3LWX4_9TELE
MEQSLSVFVVLVLAVFCKEQDWETPDFCQGKQCPKYKLVDKIQNFEERLIVATDWITTKIVSPTSDDMLAAHNKLKDYCQKQREAGYEIPDNTWPALITVTEGDSGLNLSLSWFLPPDTRKPAYNDPAVTLQTIPESTFYVRVYGGTPSIESAQDNVEVLREDLVKDGKTFTSKMYMVALYDSFFALSHHNEVLICSA